MSAAIPTEQVVIGVFALFGAAITGAFSIYNTKVNGRIKNVEQKTEKNGTLTLGNELLDQIVPALERKDEALDKIAEILDNILEVQKLQNTRLTALQMLTKDTAQAVRDFVDTQNRKGGEEG